MHASYSSMNQHRSCPQKWVYQREMNLVKIQEDEAPPRDFGSWWHALMAADSIMRGRELGSLKSVPDTLTATDKVKFTTADVTVEIVFDAAASFWAGLDEESREAWTKYLGESLPDRLRGAYSRWLDRWQKDRSHEHPLAVELGWSRDLGNTGTRLVGYLDEIYLDTRRSIVVVRDHKTLKTLATQTTQDDLMDSQLHLYAWGAAPVVEAWGVGPIRATAYDRVRSVASTRPRLNNSGTLSKQVTQFDLRTYLDWVAEGQEYPGTKKDGSGAGIYQADDAVIERLSQPSWESQWHQRTLTPINVNVIRTHLRAAVESINDIQKTREMFASRGEAVRNPGDACRWCDYSKLCMAQLLGGVDGEYDLDAMGLKISDHKRGR